MTPNEAAHRWRTRADEVERWAELRMLSASRTPDGWRLAATAHPPYRFGPTLHQWLEARQGTAPAMAAEAPE
jgi:hypothetical protein